MKSFINRLLANKSSARKSKDRRRALAVETLTDRTLMAASITASLNTADGILRIEGTHGDDQIQVRQGLSTIRVDGLSIAVTNGGVTTQSAVVPSTQVSRIIVAALDGNDRVEMNDVVTPLARAKPMVIHGGMGNDTLFGGKGADTIYGESGVDSILGGDGKDALYGDANPEAAKLARDYNLNIQLTSAELNGKQIKWLSPKYEFGGSNSWYYITPAGDLYHYSDWDNDSEQILDSFVQSYDPSYFDDIRPLELERGLYDGGLYYNWGLRDEMWFEGVGDAYENRFYFVTPVGEVFHWDGLVELGPEQSTGQLLATLDFSYHVDPRQLVAAATDDGANDELDGQEGDDYIDGGAGADILKGMLGNDTLFGWIGNDTIYGGIGDDYIDGQQDDDWINGQENSDTIIGFDGQDSLFGWTGNDTIYGGAGDDYMDGQQDNDTMDGQENNDTLIGYNGADWMAGSGGDDSLYGGFGKDSLFGGFGNDTIDGQENNDTIDGQEDNDRLLGSGGADWMNGSFGMDSLYGGFGNDSLYGGFGNDTIDGQEDNDTIDGQEDDDRLLGSGGADWMNGSFGMDSLYGGFGNDSLYGGFGNDLLEGQESNDTIDGQEDNDTLVGLAGKDTLFGGPGADSLNGGQHSDSLHGGQGDDLLFGGDDSDQLFGGSENDRLFGENGADRLFGQEGDDDLYGGDNFDRLEGGIGDDGLFGGAFDGADMLIGGPDEDRFLTMIGEDIVQNPETVDARITFQNSPALNNISLAGQTGTYSFAAGSWDNAQIQRVDVALANLHHRVGNTRLLKTSARGEMSFLAVGMQTSPGFQAGGWNNGTQIVFVNLPNIATAFLERTVYHEFGHNWDNPSENRHAAEFRAVSGWQVHNNGGGSLFPPDGFFISTDGAWDYRASAANTFARDYGRTNPDEDMATMWESYFVNAYHGGTDGLIREELISNAAKWSTIDALLSDLQNAP